MVGVEAEKRLKAQVFLVFLFLDHSGDRKGENSTITTRRGPLSFRTMYILVHTTYRMVDFPFILLYRGGL